MRPALRFTPAFTPISIGGCQLWLDGADISTIITSTGVSQWNDKSGNAYNLTQGSSGSQPSYASNLITFESNKYLNIPASVMNNISTWSLIFAINPISSSNWIMAKQKDYVDTYNVLSMTLNTATSGAILTGSTGFLYWRSMNAGTQAVSTAAITTSTIQIVNLTYDGTNLYFYKNGVLEKTTAGTFAIQNDITPSTYTLGVSIYPGGQILNPGVTNFRLGEMIIYSSFLNLTQRQQIEGYLAQKWGLKTFLPGGHIGVTTTIYPTQRVARGLSIPYSTQFSPTSTSGCQLWLDGSDSTTITTVTGVSQWNDKSGNAYNLTQGNTSLQPTRTENLLNFLSNYNMNIPQAAVNNLSTWSLFFVINPISSLNWIMVKQKDGQNTYNVLSMTYNTNSGGNGETGSTGFLYWRSLNHAGQLVSTAALTTSTLQICNLTYDGTNLYFYKNGLLEKTTAGTFAIQNDTNANNYTLGVWIQSGGFINSGVTNFRLGEILVYNTFLNTTQRQQLESYLAQKWGITASLPVSHLNTTFPAGLPSFTQTVFKQVKRNITSIPLISPPVVSLRLINLNSASGGTTSGSFTVNSSAGGGTGTFTNSDVFISDATWGMAQCFNGARSDYDLYMTQNPNFMEIIFPRALTVTKIFLVPRNQGDAFPSSLVLKADGTTVGTYTPTTVSQSLGMGISYTGTGFYIQPSISRTTWRFDFSSTPVSFGEIEFWGYST